MQIKIGISTNKKLLELFNSMKSGDIELRPSFQRKLVWNNKHKEAFIETILRGLPFPEIYLADGDIDLVTQRSKSLVVDGQQRLNTIYQYVTGSKEFPLKSISSFEKLTDKEKTDFFDYTIVVRDLGRIEEDKLTEIFKRINSVMYALNAMEIQNALYEGDFITCAKEILSESDFKDIEIFSETEYSRMRDLEFILLIMSTIEENGYFSGTKEVESHIVRFDNDYPEKEIMKSNVKDCVKLILDTEIPPDSIWMRKSNFFTLSVELIKFKRENGLSPNTKDLKLALLELEKKIIENKNADTEKNEYARYYKYVFSGTASRIARITRGELLRKHLSQLK